MLVRSAPVSANNWLCSYEVAEGFRCISFPTPCRTIASPRHYPQRFCAHSQSRELASETHRAGSFPTLCKICSVVCKPGLFKNQTHLHTGGQIRKACLWRLKKCYACGKRSLRRVERAPRIRPPACLVLSRLQTLRNTLFLSEQS